MEDIVSKIQKEIINRSNAFEKRMKWTKNEFNIYKEHIQYVYNNVILLSKGKDVDVEVLKLSALLHDIAMTNENLDRSRHNEYWANIAEKLLREYSYPEEKIQLVKKCILNHSSIRIQFRTTQEEQILVDADCLSHFDSINNLYSLAHNVMNLNDNDCLEYIQWKLTKDYNELSSNLKSLVTEKYNKIMSAKQLKDIIN